MQRGPGLPRGPENLIKVTNSETVIINPDKIWTNNISKQVKYTIMNLGIPLKWIYELKYTITEWKKSIKTVPASYCIIIGYMYNK